MSMGGLVILQMSVNVRPINKILCDFCVSDVFVQYDPDVRGGGGSSLFKANEIGQGGGGKKGPKSQ